ncbi:MAG: hypothetical protein H7235_05395 [Bdellovibrionaceae bacterium]|nr:hypothetical protein [Pseudobdellovibrionaceae bacterium]
MTLQILDGQLQSTNLPLQQNYVFKADTFQDSEMQTEHAKIFLDHNFNWKISGLGGSKIRVSHDEMDAISLMPGLIFHIGQTGFKVVERAHPLTSEWENISAEFINNLNLDSNKPSELFFFLLPVQIVFSQGPQSGDIYTLSYGPRILGSNNLDLNLKDPLLPHELLKFTQVGDSVMIENLAGEKSILVNKKPFTTHKLFGADRFTFGSNIMDISILR